MTTDQARSTWRDEEAPFPHHRPGKDKIDLRVFDQDQYWMDADNTVHALADMGAEYRANVIAHIREHAAQYLDKITLLDRSDELDARYDADPDLELDAADMVAFLTRPADISPADWIETTPLMRALQALTPVPRP